MALGKYEQWLTSEGLALLEGWARNGLTEEQIAHNCGIASKTLRAWKKAYSPISTALKKGKEVVDLEVENALFKRAIGYDYEETKTEQTANGVSVTTYRRHMPPDTTAQIFWLKNRKPEVWRDKRENTEQITIDPAVREAVENFVVNEHTSTGQADSESG